jgi:hypothetical protein
LSTTSPRDSYQQADSLELFSRWYWVIYFVLYLGLVIFLFREFWYPTDSKLYNLQLSASLFSTATGAASFVAISLEVFLGMALLIGSGLLKLRNEWRRGKDIEERLRKLEELERERSEREQARAKGRSIRRNKPV